MFLTASIGGGWEHMKNITNTTGGAGFSCGRWEQYLFLYLFPSPLAVLVEKINPTNESRDSFNSDIIRAFRIFYVFIAICENHHKVGCGIHLPSVYSLVYFSIKKSSYNPLIFNNTLRNCSSSYIYCTSVNIHFVCEKILLFD